MITDDIAIVAALMRRMGHTEIRLSQEELMIAQHDVVYRAVSVETGTLIVMARPPIDGGLG